VHRERLKNISVHNSFSTMWSTISGMDNSQTIDIQLPDQAAKAPTDDQLILAILAGDETSFESLFERHKRRVGLIAGRFFKQKEQIEEIIQETFTKVYLALKEFSNKEENSFAAWISRIAFNVCYDELRRKKRRSENAFSDITEEEFNWIEQRLQNEEFKDDIEKRIVERDLANKFLDRLTPDERLILVLLEVEELSTAEIAAITNWSVSKVKVKAHRARGSLRRLFKKFL
jgi:RNA polymerase sigma-70 factor, ECF subfamily